MNPEQTLSDLMQAVKAGDMDEALRISTALSPGERAAVADVGFARLADLCATDFEEQQK